jgi:hypothetical protein
MGIISTSPIKNVDQQTPCPICGHTDWCSYSEDGATIICRRIEAGSIRTGTDASGVQYYVHLTEVGKGKFQSRIEQERAAAGTIPQASPKFTHEFYKYLLSILSLTHAHREALRARGLTDEEIDRLGYKSWPDEPPWKFAKRLAEKYGREACLSIPGFYYSENRTKTKRYLTLNCRPGFIIPSINLDGQIQALITRNDKPDGGTKYILLSSKKRGGFPPSMECHVPVFSGDHQTIRVTEGILKADIATIRSGILTLGLHGLGWKKSIPTLQRLAPTRILLAFDADASRNLHVAQSLKRFVETLRAELPAARIGLEIWPDTCGKGIDDVLAAGYAPSVLDDPQKIDSAIADILSKAEESQKSEKSPNDPDLVIEELNKKHAILPIGSQITILWEHENPINKQIDIDFLRKPDFMILYENRFVEVKDESGNKKLKPAAKHWLSSPDRRSYDQLIFAPGAADDPRYFNLWRGFAVKPAAGDWSLFRAHILENICSGDESLYQYVFAWMADIVQNPTDKPGVALVLRGKQGTGKGIFCREFGALFGQHFTHISQSKHLTGSFNAHLKDCLVLFADEAFWAGEKSSEGALKALITEPNLVIEMKGKDAITMPNHVHLVIASNNDWVIPAGLEERRFCVIDVDDSKMQDHIYFSKIIEQMNNRGREALLYDLQQYDLSTINLRHAPQTAALFEQKIQSFHPIEQFWYGVLQLGKFFPNDQDWRDEIDKDQLYQLYCTTIGQAGIGRKNFQTGFCTQLRRICPGLEHKQKRVPLYDELNQVIGSTRKRYWIIPELEICRKQFEQIVNTKIEWPKEEEEEEDAGSRDGYLPF